ncbi:MAG: hypothetical protein AB2989_02245 [Candidatus Symbiodolus clandestinus]
MIGLSYLRPPLALPNFLGTTSLSATLSCLAYLSRVSSWLFAYNRATGLPVLQQTPPLMHAIATIPAELAWYLPRPMAAFPD